MECFLPPLLDGLVQRRGVAGVVVGRLLSQHVAPLIIALEYTRTGIMGIAQMASAGEGWGLVHGQVGAGTSIIGGDQVVGMRPRLIRCAEAMVEEWPGVVGTV